MKSLLFSTRTHHIVAVVVVSEGGGESGLNLLVGSRAGSASVDVTIGSLNVHLLSATCGQCETMRKCVKPHVGIIFMWFSWL